MTDTNKVDVEPINCATPETCPDHAHLAYVHVSALSAAKDAAWKEGYKQGLADYKAAAEVESASALAELRQENEKLKAEFNQPVPLSEWQQLRTQLAEAKRQMEAQKDEWLAWEAKRKGLEADAARWKWFQENVYRYPYEDHGCGPEFDLSNEAIDAARAALKGDV